MAKISTYKNYKTGKTDAEIGEFETTGVIPVSGTYTENGDMETKNVKLSELVGGGGGDADSLAGQGLHVNDGKLTVDTDNTLNIKVVDVGYSETRYKVSVTNAVPTPGADHADADKVLTVKTIDNTDKIVWDTPQGGGGNPYTKVNVTPGDCYLNGEKSSYDFDLYDQDVTISNNTYSVLPSPIGYYPAVEEPEWHMAHNLDNLVIKLPDDTAFPMAVVEFTVQDSDDYYQQGCVNNVKVKVGNTELTRMYSAPYNPNTLLLGGDHHDQFEYWKLVTEPNQGNPYYRIEEIHNEYRGADISAFVHGTKVQVHIFGSCFNITVSQACGEPSGS